MEAACYSRLSFILFSLQILDFIRTPRSLRGAWQRLSSAATTRLILVAVPTSPRQCNFSMPFHIQFQVLLKRRELFAVLFYVISLCRTVRWPCIVALPLCCRGSPSYIFSYITVRIDLQRGYSFHPTFWRHQIQPFGSWSLSIGSNLQNDLRLQPYSRTFAQIIMGKTTSVAGCRLRWGKEDLAIWLGVLLLMTALVLCSPW